MLPSKELKTTKVELMVAMKVEEAEGDGVAESLEEEREAETLEDTSIDAIVEETDDNLLVEIRPGVVLLDISVLETSEETDVGWLEEFAVTA